jgi:hypothetical protein
MPTLKEFASTYSGKKDITDVKRIPVETQVNSGTFKNSDGKDMPFNYFEIDSYKYTIKAKVLAQIKYLLEQKPNIKAFKVSKAPNGELVVFDVD